MQHRGTVISLTPPIGNSAAADQCWEIVHVDYDTVAGEEEDEASAETGEVMRLRCADKHGRVSNDLLAVDAAGKLALMSADEKEASSVNNEGCTTTLWLVYRFPNGQAALKAKRPLSSSGDQPPALYLSVQQDGSNASALDPRISRGSVAVVVDEDGALPVFTLSMKFPPIVDVSLLLQAKKDTGKDGDDEDEEEESDELHATRQKLLDACHDVGCFFMIGHGLNPDPLLRGLQEGYGKLPHSTAVGDDEKANSSGEKSAASYDAPVANDATASGDRFTKITLQSSTGLVKTSFNPPVHDPIVMPQWATAALPKKAETVAEYYRAASAVGCALLAEMAQRDFTPSEDLYLLMRAVCYPTRRAGDAEFSARFLETHTDKSWITLLAATAMDGLQFVDADGETFVDIVAPHLDDDAAAANKGPLMLVNVGDALQMHSEGAFVSRPHRAMNREGEVPRVSVPLFVEPDPDRWPQNYTAEKMVMYEL